MNQQDDHEHLFPEEQEPSGRRILAPCLTCNLSALDALQQTKDDRDRYDREAAMWAASAKDYLRLITPLMTREELEALEATGGLPDSLAERKRFQP